MLVIIAVHKDGDILGQKNLDIKSVKYLEKHDFGKHYWFIDSIDFELNLDRKDFPNGLSKFIEKHECDAKAFFLDDRLHDPKKDFDEEEWLSRSKGKE